MKRLYKLRVNYLLGDIATFIGAYWITNWIRFYYEGISYQWDSLSQYLFGVRNSVIGSLLLLIWLIIFFFSGYYNRPDKRDRMEDFLLTLYSVLLGSSLQFLFVITNDKIFDTSKMMPLFFVISFIYFTSFYIIRSISTSIVLHNQQKPVNFTKVLVIGSKENIYDLRSVAKDLRINIVSEIPIQEVEYDQETMYNEIRLIVKEKEIDAFYLVFDSSMASTTSRILYNLFPLEKEIYVTATALRFTARNLHRPSILTMPLFNIAETQMSESSKNIKWAFDKIASIIALIIVAPLFLIITIGVKHSSKGKVFYCQKRIGLHGRPFTIYKFRSMYEGSENTGPTLSYKDDPRITPIGKKLRKYRLDELPQLYNILRGDMSFVGPRPERSYYISKLVEKAPYYYLLHNVRPGITSLGMVLYGYASTLDEMHTRLQADWIYYNNMSLNLDFKVLIYTVSIILKGKGK